jgi:hypothetical protein
MEVVLFDISNRCRLNGRSGENIVNGLMPPCESHRYERGQTKYKLDDVSDKRSCEAGRSTGSVVEDTQVIRSVTDCGAPAPNEDRFVKEDKADHERQDDPARARNVVCKPSDDQQQNACSADDGAVN